MKVATYLGSGNNVYASLNNLYVAVTQYEEGKLLKPENAVMPSNFHTVIYKFTLQDGRAKYTAQGKVPGNILNQFSMDEYQDNFRIATTAEEPWRSNRATEPRNNLYILDKAMKTVGKIENIAPGERIYSVRFMGGRGYMVTFKQVDPLFVIDLKDPKAPKILGSLKIPGYSDYLHPYDENHILGFGKDTETSPKGGPDGNRDIGFYQGMKMALFDVSDVKNPKEKFKEIIGDRGTDSDLLFNHKALLFSKEKNLLAFPVRLAEIKNKKPGNVTDYGEFTYQGAYIYHIDLKEGFKLRGRITHITTDEHLKYGEEFSNGTNNIDRILYINDTLYTLSRAMIKAHDLAELKQIKNLPLPQ